MEPNNINPTTNNDPAAVPPSPAPPEPTAFQPVQPQVVTPAQPAPLPGNVPTNPQIQMPPQPATTLPPGIVVGGDSPIPGSQPQAVFTPTIPGTPAPKGRRFSSKAIMIAVLAVVLLGGGSAAAYFAVAANSPKKLLKTALINTVQAQQVSFSGKVTDDSDGASATVNVDGQVDSAKKAASTTVKLTVSGVNIDLDARLVDDNIYVKVGDLNEVLGILSVYSPDAATELQKVTSIVSNKWIEIDSTLLKEAGGECVLSTNWQFTDNDVKLLTDQYAKHPFATIDKTSSDTVGGKSATKYELTLDNKKGDEYANSLDSLSIAKAADKCAGADSLKDDATSAAGSGTTKLTLWVDKGSKKISQVSYAAPSSSSDKLKATVNFSYGPVSISAPDNPTPVVTVLTQVQTALGATDTSGLTSLFSGLASGTTDTTDL
jgi:hypothetical protein